MRLTTGSKYNYKYSNRGMNLEEEINSSNQYYLEKEIAAIYKKPTPITINKVSYKSRADAKITEAHFKTPSTTDYNGVYKGRKAVVSDKFEDYYQEYISRTINKVEFAKKLKISRPTLDKLIKEREAS